VNEDAAPVAGGNLVSDLPVPGAEEVVTLILERPGLRIERIVSLGHATPADAPYEQAEDEWVMVVQGAARLWLDGRGEVALRPGDHLVIPAGVRHRVTWTAPDEPTVWLAVHVAV
jgi:cupin 2 domain-containing protein